MVFVLLWPLGSHTEQRSMPLKNKRSELRQHSLIAMILKISYGTEKKTKQKSSFNICINCHLVGNGANWMITTIP